MSLQMIIMLTILLLGIAFVLGAITSSKSRYPTSRTDPQPELRTCPRCGFLNVSVARFCAQCGAELDRTPPENDDANR